MTTAARDEMIEQVREDYNRLRGRLFETLEALGLPDRQLDAVKRLIRRLSYESQADLESLVRTHTNQGER